MGMQRSRIPEGPVRIARNFSGKPNTHTLPRRQKAAETIVERKMKNRAAALCLQSPHSVPPDSRADLLSPRRDH
jgi:hypothetical protein